MYIHLPPATVACGASIVTQKAAVNTENISQQICFDFPISTLVPDVSVLGFSDWGTYINSSSITFPVLVRTHYFEMLSLISLAAASVVSVVQAEFLAPWTLPTYSNIEACVGLPAQYSCENITVLTDSCCNVVKGGLVLQTQYWDTYTGLEYQGQLLPKGSWSIHGLWPDNCDG